MSDIGSGMSLEATQFSGANGAKPALSVVPSVGSMLATARTEQNWTLADIAEKLKLSTKQIVALESNQFEALPSMVVVRGFIRSYARFLRLDVDAVLNLLPPEPPAIPLSEHLKPSLSTPFVESRLSLMNRQNQNHFYLIGVAVVGVLLMAFLLFQKFDLSQYFPLAQKAVSSTDSASVRAPLSANPAPVQSPEIVQSQASVAPVEEVKQVKQAAEAPSVSSAENTINSLTPVKNTATNSTSASAANASLAAEKLQSNSVVEPVKKEQLQLTFSQDSWIQVKNAKGTVLTSHLSKAGTVESFDVDDTLQVRIGNAAGVKASLRGNVLELSPDKGSNVANLVVK
ncbi:MAG: DUF4115 domain-containing protein [Burkholderiaceae bacterium]|nr:DUF4115 domain-containing protein [Burkholderiaceae bacterium]